MADAVSQAPRLVIVMWVLYQPVLRRDSVEVCVTPQAGAGEPDGTTESGGAGAHDDGHPLPVRHDLGLLRVAQSRRQGRHNLR